jgi:hypothetical protein
MFFATEKAARAYMAELKEARETCELREATNVAYDTPCWCVFAPEPQITETNDE